MASETVHNLPLEIINKDGQKSTINHKVRLLSVDKEKIENMERAMVAKSNLSPEEIKNYDKYKIIPEPYNSLQLTQMEEQSNVLRECIDSMVNNTVGFGHVFRPRKMSPQLQEKYKSKIEKELAIVDSYFDAVCPDVPWKTLIRQAKRNYENTGNLYIETVRDGLKTVQINLPASHNMRLIKQDKNPTYYTHRYVDPSEGYKIKTKKAQKYFRRFVQVDNNGQPLVYFKEFGDPRNIDKRTGEVITGKVNPNQLATEIIHLKIYSARSPYGIPRWISRVISIQGSRRAEEVNYFTLSNNHVPTMFVMVENGSLTPGSVERLRELIETQVAGNPNHGVIVILEAEGVEYNFNITNSPQAKVKIQPVKEAQHDDQLYQEYDKNNRKRVRSSFRLAPIHTGDSDDYSHASVKEARRITDEQVFNPEREEWDIWVNKVLVDDGIRFLVYKSRTPNITENSELVKAMEIAERSGGMTPYRANTLLEDVFEGSLGPEPTGIDLHVPYSLQFAQAQNAQRPPPGRPLGTGPNQEAAAASKLAAQGIDPAAEQKAQKAVQDAANAKASSEAGLDTQTRSVDFAEVLMDEVLRYGIDG